jgi:outer membrane protein TolC
MIHKIIITILLSVSCLSLWGQGSIPSVLQQIEANNKTLAARASLAQAESLEARVGNSLPDPEIQYEHVWGSPASLGKQGEFVASQSFDFPTAYIARARLAKMRGQQADNGYQIYRQQVFLEAQELCFEIIALRRQRELLETHRNLTAQLAETSAKELEAGVAGVLKVSESRLHLLAAENELRLLDVEITDALGRLKILNGGVDIDFPDNDFPLQTDIMPFDEMARIYAESDPLLTGAALEGEVAKQQAKTARSESLPKLSLGYKLEFGGGERFNGFVAGVSIPMFGNRHNVKAARARELYASLVQEDMQTSVTQTLVTLYEKASLLEESIRNYKKITQETESYLKYLEQTLSAGEITVTDYFTQYDGILVYKKELIELTRQYHIVRSRIYSVLLK